MPILSSVRLTPTPIAKEPERERAHSSCRTAVIMTSAPAPPYRSSYSRPKKPSSPMRRKIAFGMRPAVSHASTCGITSFSTKDRTVARNMSCCSSKTFTRYTRFRLTASRSGKTVVISPSPTKQRRASSAGFAAAQLVWGPLSDRLGRRRVLLAGLAVYATAGTACAFAPSMSLLIAARVVQALGAGSGPVIARAVVRDLYEPERAARVLAAMGTAQALTPILAPIIGGWVHVLAGWRAVFVVLGAFGSAFLLTAWRIVPETNVYAGARAAEPGGRGAALLRPPRYAAYVGAAALMFRGS